MVFIDGVKYACQRCIRGHRVTSCTHSDQPLVMIKPKGRPASQCSHCREARKRKSLHVKCLCGTGSSKGPKLHRSDCPCAVDSEKCTCASTKNRQYPASGHVVKSSRIDARHSDVGIIAHGPSVPPELWAHPMDHYGRSNIRSITDSASPLSPANGQLDIPLESATSTFVPFDTLAGRIAAKHELPVQLPNVPNGLNMEYNGFGSATVYPVTFHAPNESLVQEEGGNSWPMTNNRPNMNDMEWGTRNSLEIW